MKTIVTIATLTLATTAAVAGGIASNGPNPEAPEEIRQFGQLVGSWHCTGENLQQDGIWKETPGVSTWDWYYVLDGYAVQDVWRPGPEAGPQAAQGTNLRTFDPDAGTWEVVWTTQKVPKIDFFRAGFRDGEMHMYAERAASELFPSHLMHITFHNISEEHFDWRYESSGLTDGQTWREVSRLSCKRVQGGTDPDSEPSSEK